MARKGFMLGLSIRYYKYQFVPIFKKKWYHSFQNCYLAIDAFQTLEQYIPYTLTSDLFSRYLETYWYWYESLYANDHFNMEQYIPYSLICDLFSRKLETYLLMDILTTLTINFCHIENHFSKHWKPLSIKLKTIICLF